MDSLFVLFHFVVSLSANGGASDRESFCRLLREAPYFEFFAVLISRPILRYEYYQIYCVLAALFSRFAFFCLANTLSFVSPYLPLRLACDTCTKKSPMYLLSHVVTGAVARRRRCRELRFSSIILTLYKRRREESPLFFFIIVVVRRTNAEPRGVDLARRPISRSVEDGGSRCIVAVQGRG